MGRSAASAAKDAHGNAHVGDLLHTDNQNTLVHASSRFLAEVKSGSYLSHLDEDDIVRFEDTYGRAN